MIAVHAGAVWALVSWPVDASDGSPGVFAVELAPEIYAGAREDTDKTVKSAERAVKHTPAPTPLTAPPSPLAPEPVVAAAPRHTPEPEKEPEKEKVRRDETATAEADRQDQPPADAATAPTATAGLSPLAAKAQAAWYQDLAKRIDRYKNYPKAAMAQRLQGRVRLRFTIDRTGRVLLAQVVESSGSQLLDAEAMAMLKKAAPLPLPPAETPDESFDLTLPIDFKLQ